MAFVFRDAHKLRVVGEKFFFRLPDFFLHQRCGNVFLVNPQTEINQIARAAVLQNEVARGTVPQGDKAHLCSVKLLGLIEGEFVQGFDVAEVSRQNASSFKGRDAVKGEIDGRLNKTHDILLLFTGCRFQRGCGSDP